MPSEPDLRVSERHVAVLKWLAAVDDDRVLRLVESLAGASPVASPDELSVAAAPATGPGIASDALLDALMSINVLRSAQGVGLDALADVVAKAAQVGEAATTLAERLRRILAVEPLWHAAKSFDLGSAFDRSLQHPRIITDIRPIFHDDESERPSSALILHTLEMMTYDQNGHANTIYVALDEADLDALGHHVDRAKRKGETVRQLLSEASVNVHTWGGKS